MPSEELKKLIREDVLKLIGCELTDIRVRTFCVEFVFYGLLTIILRAKKDFRFEIKNGEGLYFNPARVTHDLDSESSKFIFFAWKAMSSSLLKGDNFRSLFSEGGRLWIEFENSDFEPFELVGMS